MHTTFDPRKRHHMNTAPMQGRAGYEWVSSYTTELVIGMERLF